MAKEKELDCTIEKEELLHCLYLVQGVVEKRSSLPILSHVLIEGSDETVSLGATDLEIGIRQQCKATIKRRGAVTTDARKLYEIVREFPPERLVLRSSGEGWVEVSSGRSRFRMASLDPKEFPAITPGARRKDEQEASATASLPEKTLGEMIEKTLFASSADESRLNLSGVYLEALPSGKLRLVSSDGHRLAIIEREAGISEADSWPHVILPRKGLLEARKLLEKDERPIDLSLHGSTAVMKKGTTELSMRLIEGEFPDYQQVVPKDKKDPLSFSRDEFLGAIRRLLVLTTERARGVKLQVEKERMVVSVNTPDLGEGEEEIEIKNQEGGSLIIGFNGRYLTEVLNVIDEGVNINLYLKDEVSPGLLQVEGDEDFSYVIMPMRIF